MVFDFYRSRADIVCIQETHSVKENEEIWKNEWGGKILFSHGTSNARGVAVLVGDKCALNVEKVDSDLEGRILACRVNTGDKIIGLINVYAPNEDKSSFADSIEFYLQKTNTENIIINGDFNLALNPEVDRVGTSTNNNKLKESLINLMRTYHLNDLWRIRNPTEKQFTWFKIDAKNKKFKGSRIDFMLVSAGLDTDVQNIMFLPGLQTDHRAVYAAVETKESKRGAGYWKFNNSLLQEECYVRYIEEELKKDLLCSENMPHITKWEVLKKRIKRLTQNYSKNKTSENKLIVSQLTETVNEFESRLPLNKKEYKILEDTRKDLEEMLMDRTASLIFRSKAKWYELGEKSNKYFYNLEKSNYNAKTCFKLVIDEHVIEDQSEILEKQREYYTNLYSENENVQFELENNSGIRVSDIIQESQNKQITKEEIYTALKQLPRNKTPGDDGLSVELYLALWDLLSQPFYNAILQVYEEGIYYESARRGVLNLIPKPGKDSRKLDNLRPITLLNVDYKIMEKAIANKMMPALEEIINSDQKGFMQGRRISVNIRKNA